MVATGTLDSEGVHVFAEVVWEVSCGDVALSLPQLRESCDEVRINQNSNPRRPPVRLIVTSLLLAVALVGAGATAEAGQATGTTHQFEATTYYNTFSFAHPPALRIRPGDRVVTKTIDAGGYDENNDQVANGPNPQIGPFYVEGAEPGDVLVVSRPVPRSRRLCRSRPPSRRSRGHPATGGPECRPRTRSPRRSGPNPARFRWRAPRCEA